MSSQSSAQDTRLYIQLHHDPAACNIYSILEGFVLFSVARSTIRGSVDMDGMSDILGGKTPVGGFPPAVLAMVAEGITVKSCEDGG
ncbi:hypothetical protein K7X08_034138 [Anisodus acutangulus]|uniref:Uncharacterized protein n=1 Tax=Anisodus acutangulus TaxID=402998 RepID=A0A9Q1M421_9SOLA|nr:hypothetical protein K7X08_034138 [Anisodus acutangulus]